MWQSVWADLIADVFCAPIVWIAARLVRRLLREWRDAMAQDRAADRVETAALIDQRLADHRADIANQLAEHRAALTATLQPSDLGESS